MRGEGKHVASPALAAIRTERAQRFRESEIDDGREPFGMPFTNREVAVILANELNGHDPGLWFYRVERHIDNKRWIIVREGRHSEVAPSSLQPRRFASSLKARRAGLGAALS